MNLPDDSASGRTRSTLNALRNPKGSLHLGVLNVRTFEQMRQQAALKLSGYMYPVSGTRMQDSITVSTLRGPDGTSFSRFTVSCPVVRFSVFLIMLAMRLLFKSGACHVGLDFQSAVICAVRLDRSVLVNSNSLKHRYHLVVSVYVISNFSSP